MRLLKLLKRKRKATKKFWVEIAFPNHTIAIVYDRDTYVEAIYRVYDLWKLDDGKTFSMGAMMQAVSWIDISIHGG